MDETYHPAAIGEDVDKLLGDKKYKEPERQVLKEKIKHEVTDVRTGIKFINGMKSNVAVEWSPEGGKSAIAAYNM